MKTEHTDSPRPLTLRKSAKLRHRTLVNDLFQKGKSVYAGPLRLTYRSLTADELTESFREAVPDMMGPVQMMVTVPKKKRRHAVDRVLMRRRIRESFRLQWHPLRALVEQDPAMRTLSLGFIYLDSCNHDFAEIEAAMASALAKLQKRLWPQPEEPQDC